MGSLNRGDLAAIDAFEKKIGGNMDKIAYQIMSQLRSDAARTSMSRLGFASNAVADASIRDFLGRYSEMFNEVSVSRKESIVNEQADKLVNEPLKPENKEKERLKTPYVTWKNSLQKQLD